MNKQIKKIISAILILCLSVTGMCAITASASTPEIIAPQYNNTSHTGCTMKINESGLMTINYNVDGKPDLMTKAVITTNIEKRTLGLFWSKVDIGTQNNEWIDTTYSCFYTKKRTYQLSSSGTYRINVEIKVYGSGGTADTVNYQLKDSY